MNYKEYTQYIAFGDRMSRSRILIVPDKEDRQRLLLHLYNQPEKVEHIAVSDCILATQDFIPMPPAMLEERLAHKIEECNRRGKTAFVNGLSGYFLLLDDLGIKTAFDILKSMLENSDVHAVWLLNNEYAAMKTCFLNPRFAEQGKLVWLSDTGAAPDADREGLQDKMRPVFFNAQWKSSLRKCEADLKACLARYEKDDTFVRRPYVPIICHGRRLPGLNPAIRQLVTLSDFMNDVYGISEGLSDAALQLLCNKLSGCDLDFTVMDEGSVHALSYLRDLFLGKDAPETSYPKMIHEAEEAEKEILVWLLKMLLKPTADGLYNSWLSYVLYHKEFRLSGFLDCYVCAAADAATELDTKQTGLFTAERKKGLSELGVENARNEIEAFISMSSGIQTEQIAPWLNNGTESEKTELIARVGREKLNVLPAAYYDVYHEFFVYMTDYDLDNEELDHYFRDYRMAKLHDFVSPALYEKAATLDVLDLVESRDVCVQKYCNDPDTALLFVDGFGVEYVPLLYALMTKYISSCEICHANIPTITETNAIQWPSERRIDPIDRVDKVGHFGSGSGKSVASSLYAVLDVVERMICPCVIRGLKEYKRVLLTADHGSSRLVVTAHNQGVSKSLVLPPSARPADWRYTQAIPGQPVPAGSRANFSETYWAVCGYDRFPQSGGREYEVHGGITPEEVLVPVVLFQNDGQHLFGKKKTACKSEFALDTVFDEFDL